jgi:diaminohydroxyphosphoribosylaminopyrimidine deaminase/5-amino-6-(5-phosphoribosylamino)uracil reductase
MTGSELTAAPIADAMRLAMAQAELALGATSPNPPVGAVILDPDGVVVGVGHTQPAGGAHAEVMALRAAGDRARGGTAVVTLEPCNHTGRTPPCVDALLVAGVRVVAYAVPDPGAREGGGGARLAERGVRTIAGLLAADASGGAIRWWLQAQQRCRPFVLWKFASTLDGRVAAADGSSRWISSVQSRADVQVLRGQLDAIMVGVGTVIADNPALTARDRAGQLTGRQPLRVVLDRSGRIPPDSQVLDGAATTMVVNEPTPAAVLSALWDRGIRSVLLEGGPTVAGAFLQAGCIDEVVAYLAPKLLGAGPLSLADTGITTILDAVELDLIDVRRIGSDVRLVATVRVTPAGNEFAR